MPIKSNDHIQSLFPFSIPFPYHTNIVRRHMPSEYCIKVKVCRSGGLGRTLHVARLSVRGVISALHPFLEHFIKCLKSYKISSCHANKSPLSLKLDPILSST